MKQLFRCGLQLCLVLALPCHAWVLSDEQKALSEAYKITDEERHAILWWGSLHKGDPLSYSYSKEKACSDAIEAGRLAGKALEEKRRKLETKERPYESCKDRDLDLFRSLMFVGKMYSATELMKFEPREFCAAETMARTISRIYDNALMDELDPLKQYQTDYREQLGRTCKVSSTGLQVRLQTIPPDLYERAKKRAR